MNTENKTLKTDMQELSPLLLELIESGVRVRLTVTGNSMYPMLRGGVDSVVLAKPDKVGSRELPLYRRDDGKFVLHRIVKEKSGIYTMCGDNQTELEHSIRRDQIVAVAVEFSRNGRTVSCSSLLYRAYVALWVFLRPVRPMIVSAYLYIRRKFSKRR